MPNPRHAYEKQDIGLICLLKQGKPVGTKVQFVVKIDDVEKTKVDGTISADANSRTGKAATAKYVPDEVAADKTHHVMTYHAVVDGEEYKTTDEIHIWPKKAKLTTLNEAGDKPLPGVRFWVLQNKEKYPKSDDPMMPQLPPYKTAGNPAVFEFPLKAGYAFALEACEPFEFVADPEKNGTALRDLKVKAKLNFEAEFVTPKRPADGNLKQWVNLPGDAVKKGTDGLGNEIEVTVGVKGDRNEATGAAVPNPLGGAGVFVFVKVKFSGPGGKKSKRNSPKTELVAGLNLSDRVAVKEAATDLQWEYTGKVELKEAGGVGKFKINVGYAGGDTCEIKIGSTATCGDATLTLTNWRKLWYEIMAPDFMDLAERDMPDGSKAWDFVPTGLTNIKTSGDATFIEYELFKGHKFTEAEALTANPGSVMKREFFERTAGPAKVYILTDYSFTKYPKNFDKGKGTRATHVKGCDINLYNNGPGGDGRDADKTLYDQCTAEEKDIDIWGTFRGIYWHPVSAYGGGTGGDTIKDITWQADIADPSVYMQKPTVEFAPDEDTATGDTDKGKTRAITLTEATLSGIGIVRYESPMIGNIPTTLDATRKAAIDSFLTPMLTIAKLRPKGNVLKFKISAEKGNQRREDRIQAIKDYITTKVASDAPLVPVHPGLDDAGVARLGTLAWAGAIDIDNSHHHKFRVKLPKSPGGTAEHLKILPGDFVGALSATKCPVGVWIEFEPQHSANGMAGQGAQKGEMLLKWGINCPLCITDTFLHELGHQYNMAVVATGTGDHQWHDADNPQAPGISTPKTVVETEVAPYIHVGTKGHAYSGKNHSGPHCAYGLTDDHKDEPNYHNVPSGTCTMFGSGPRDDSQRKRLRFCPQCQDLLRARDLRALK